MKKNTEEVKKKVNPKIITNVFIVIIAYMATYFLPYIISFKEELTYSNSILAVIIFICFIYFLKKTFVKENVQKLKNIWSLGIIFSAFLVLGNSVKISGGVILKDIGIYLSIFSISFIMDCVLVQVYKFIEKFEQKETKESKIFTKAKNKLSGRKKYIIIFLVMLLFWIPVFLAVYPGYFSYDAGSQYLQYANGYIMSWHPVMHTLITGFFVDNIGHFFGSENVGIALYIALQMILCSACFTYCIYFLDKYKVSSVVKGIGILYYTFFPVIVMYVLCSTRDTIFTVMVLFSIIFMTEALIDKEEFLKSKFLQFRFILVTFLALIFRNNGIYAYIPFFIIFILAFRKKEIIISVTIILLLYAEVIGTVYSLLGVYNRVTRRAEAFSVPLQQIARVYNYNNGSLTEEEKNKIYLYTDDETLKKYRPEISDPVKDFINFDNIGYIDFFKLWFEIGIKNPRNIYRFIFSKHIRILVS